MFVKLAPSDPVHEMATQTDDNNAISNLFSELKLYLEIQNNIETPQQQKEEVTEVIEELRDNILALASDSKVVIRELAGSMITTGIEQALLIHIIKSPEIERALKELDKLQNKKVIMKYKLRKCHKFANYETKNPEAIKFFEKYIDYEYFIIKAVCESFAVEAKDCRLAYKWIIGSPLKESRPFPDEKYHDPIPFKECCEIVDIDHETAKQALATMYQWSLDELVKRYQSIRGTQPKLLAP